MADLIIEGEKIIYYGNEGNENLKEGQTLITNYNKPFPLDDYNKPFSIANLKWDNTNQEVIKKTLDDLYNENQKIEEAKLLFKITKGLPQILKDCVDKNLTWDDFKNKIDNLLNGGK